MPVERAGARRATPIRSPNALAATGAANSLSNERACHHTLPWLIFFSLDAEGRPKKMSIELTRSFLLWCTVIDYGILLVWFLVFTLAHDWMRRLHGRWFRLSDEQFDTLHYLGMSTYKIGILLFNLVPFIVLWIIG
jgi:hypothetical protein